jgi:hypothetical protein
MNRSSAKGRRVRSRKEAGGTTRSWSGRGRKARGRKDEPLAFWPESFSFARVAEARFEYVM